MGNNKIEKNYLTLKINTLTATLLLLIMGLFIVSLFAFKEEGESIGTANKIRLETKTQKTKIIEMEKTKDYKMEEGFYPYAIIDLKGDVVASYIDSIKDKVDLESDLGYDNSFSKNEIIRYTIPLVIDGMQKGNIIIDIQKEILKVKNEYKKYLVILIVIIIGIILKINHFIKVDVVKPIRELHKGAKSILKGNYEEQIKYDYHGEVGEFCHDFEAMRDELRVVKKHEEVLKKSEKELLACISHDLKTPLSSIIGYVEGIRDGIVKDKEGIIKYSNIIIRRSRELSKLIDDILEQSKAEINKMDIKKREIYINEYLEEILNDISIDVKNNNMELKIIGELPKAIVEIDEIRITQVITNIISNSIKYAKNGKFIEISVKDKLDCIEINIKDFGEGIEFSDIPFIFNKFYRGEKSRNTKVGGSGLGLSIAKYIIESHNGKINCESQKGKETTISFTLPK